MYESLPFILSGILLGLFAGISPGPLMALIISNSVKYNKKEGIKIAFSTIVGDIPIIFITLYFFSKLSEINWFLGLISFLGAGFIFYIALENFKSVTLKIDIENAKSRSFLKGLITNMLSPHPYMFWILIGAPTTIKANEVNLLTAILFIFCFYCLLIGSKVIIALLTDKSKAFLKSNSYNLVLKILGAFLILFSILLILEGLKFFEVINY